MKGYCRVMWITDREDERGEILRWNVYVCFAPRESTETTETTTKREMRPRLLSSNRAAALSDNTHNSATGATVASVGSLLAEEILINPTSFLPSFLELKYIEVASQLGRSSLKRFLSTIISHTTTWCSKYSSFSCMTRILQCFHPYTDELSVLITYFIERHILNVYGATLMEFFMYGLKRSKVTPEGKITDITNKDKIRSALMVSLIPYFKEKLPTLFHQNIPSPLIIEHDKHYQLSIWKRKLQLMYIKIYPMFHFALEGTLLAYQWAYLFRRSIYYSPDLHVQHIIPRRLTLEDMPSKQEQKMSQSIPQNESSSSRTWTPSSAKVASFLFVSRCLFRIVTLMRRSRQRQAIERVFSDSARSAAAADPLAFTSLVYPAPEPPLSALCSQQVVAPGLCPLCNQIPVNPSASPSGFVYCYKCLVIYIRDHDGLCPHGCICSEDQIVRLNS